MASLSGRLRAHNPCTFYSVKYKTSNGLTHLTVPLEDIVEAEGLAQRLRGTEGILSAVVVTADTLEPIQTPLRAG